MIGVIVDSSDHDVVREFFELFKTPWEFYRADRQYDVVLSAGAQFDGSARLVVVYAGTGSPASEDSTNALPPADAGFRIASYNNAKLPLYGNVITFKEEGRVVLRESNSQQTIAYLSESGAGQVAQIGYHLFQEVRRLLTDGQPAANAIYPTLELHIAILRDLIVGCGIQLVEIPPVPVGHPFIVCLTHDVDHPSLRAHGWDHTTLGFLYRALVGSFVNLIRGRMPLKNLLRNWSAALRTPFIQMGATDDLWSGFAEKYLQLEEERPSTFFVIPFKDRPGKKSDGSAPAFRAARYGARDIADTLRKTSELGCEIGLHGIDAWCDDSKGQEELREIETASGKPLAGVRMHWLYFDGDSPKVLESAGASYDSTVGYNETVGYRAGTTQVYKPLNTTRLLELPLHAMDTALFYPAHLNLSSSEASALLDRLLENTVQYGGCITLNWHDRSVAPERLWGETYREFILKATDRGALFLTASQAVSWFQTRRLVDLEAYRDRKSELRAGSSHLQNESAPPLRLRCHRTDTKPFDDIPFSDGAIVLHETGAK